MNEAFNWIMLLVILAIACGAICLRRSPKAMTALAAWLMATSEADLARAKYHAERHEAWLKHLGVTESAEERA